MTPGSRGSAAADRRMPAGDFRRGGGAPRGFAHSVEKAGSRPPNHGRKRSSYSGRTGRRAHDYERGLSSVRGPCTEEQGKNEPEKTPSHPMENKALLGTPGKISRFLAVAGLAVAFAVGCGPATDPVQQTIDGIVEGAEDRQAAAIVERLSPDFQAADGSGRADDGPTCAATRATRSSAPGLGAHDRAGAGAAARGYAQTVPVTAPERGLGDSCRARHIDYDFASCRPKAAAGSSRGPRGSRRADLAVNALPFRGRPSLRCHSEERLFFLSFRGAAFFLSFRGAKRRGTPPSEKRGILRCAQEDIRIERITDPSLRSG